MFHVYGSGHKGLKVDDLEKYAELIISLGMKIPEGAVILTDVFFRFLEVSGLTERSGSKDVRKAVCPDFLADFNLQIIRKMKAGVPYAIRSSALSERGGTGIYHSSFFVCSGNESVDLASLWEKEKEVYASEFTTDARAWRKKVNLPVGMAILIQEVAGYKFADWYLPGLAGTAYSSFEGLPSVRLVVGLGTKAVKGDGLLYNSLPEDNFGFSREIWNLEGADAVNLLTGTVKGIDTHQQEVHSAAKYSTFKRLFGIVVELKKQGDFSMEWAIVGDDIHIVQFAPYEDKLPGDQKVGKDKFFLLTRGTDVLNSGKATCKGVLLIRTWSNNTAAMVEYLNGQLSGYLLIAPQQAFSLLSGIGLNRETREENVRLGFSHFSNAAAVIELQQHYDKDRRLELAGCGIVLADHSGGKGATHFQQLCSRSDILYMGCELDLSPLLALAGCMRYSDDVLAWETEAIVVVDGIKKEGFVYIAKESKNHQYSPTQIRDWSMNLREAANMLLDGLKQPALANPFYMVHYAIGNDDSPVGFDPYAIDEQILVHSGGKDGLSASIRTVIDNLQYVELHPAELDELRTYLNELLGKVQQ